MTVSGGANITFQRVETVQSCSIICQKLQNNQSYKYSLFALPIINQNLTNLSMTSNNPLKNYYSILGISEDASLFQIQSAYEKLAAKWHPDKHREHRKTAQAKFHDISEAFEVLSDRNKRSHYDELLSRQYSLEDADSTFHQFFNEHGIVDESQQQFFNQHFPNPFNSYYATLGVPKYATLDDIKNAYRKLSLKYHPRNNPNDQTAHKKFIEVSEAYNALSNQFKRANYDTVLFEQITPIRAHNIFDDFFGNRILSLEEDPLEIRQLFVPRWTKDLDRMMIDEKDEKNIKQGQTVKTSSVWSNKNGQETSKTIKSKKIVKDGKVSQETTEEVLLPTGERNITKTIKCDGRVDQKKFTLKKGEELPKELMN